MFAKTLFAIQHWAQQRPGLMAQVRCRLLQGGPWPSVCRHFITLTGGEEKMEIRCNERDQIIKAKGYNNVMKNFFHAHSSKKT